ncbi:MAG TPA: hypothetical protein VNO86_05090 [Candidatus Binatia bacterium]|nr:hypothetical protein [Candidatus Binatia bacterium]
MAAFSGRIPAPSPSSLARGARVRIVAGARLMADDGPAAAPPPGLPAVFIGRVGLSLLALVVTRYGRTLVERSALEVVEP